MCEESEFLVVFSIRKHLSESHDLLLIVIVEILECYLFEVVAYRRVGKLLEAFLDQVGIDLLL